MAVSEDKCISCGNRNRPTDLDQISPSDALDPNGTFMGLPYWFCSTDCYKKAIRKHLDTRYDFDKQPEDDEDVLQRIEDARVDYYDKAGDGLLEKLFSPVAWKSENDYIKPEVDKALDAFQTKKIGEIAGAEIEVHNRLYAEWMHQLDEHNAATEKETAKRHEQMEKLLKEEQERQELQDAYEEMITAKPIPFDYRFDHTHIIGSSGQGKSTLIIKTVLDHMLSQERPALVVIDPKGTMVNDIRMIDSFAPDSELYAEGHWKFPHLIVIDPTLFPPALNLCGNRCNADSNPVIADSR